MSESQLQARASQSTPQLANDTTTGDLQMTRDGQLFATNSYRRALLAGRLFGANSGSGTGPATWSASAYDSDGPEFHVNVPNGTGIIPQLIQVCYEDVGTEIVMEIIALASGTGDASVTVTGGALLTIYNLLLGGPQSACAANGAVDAAGVTDPNTGSHIEFWRRVRQLTDSAASGDNDRYELTFRGVNGVDFIGPVIQAEGAVGGSLTVYAVNQAGHGFVTAVWEELTPVSSYVN